IDISREEGLKIRAALKKQRERFQDNVFFALALAEGVNLPYLPLSQLLKGRRLRFRWQNSWRQAFCIYLSTDVKEPLIQRALKAIEEDLDGFVVVLPPSVDEGSFSSLMQTVHSSLKALLVCWVPQKLSPEDRQLIEEYLGMQQLSLRFPELKQTLKERTRTFHQTITDLYYEGRLLYGDGEVYERPSRIGLLPFDKLLAQVLDRPLKNIHPLHMSVMPRIEFFSEEQIRKLYKHFILKGKITLQEAEERGLTVLIRDLMGPLGLVRTKGRSYVLEVSPEEKLIKHLFDLIGEGTEWFSLVRALKKGQWGLSDLQLQLVVSSAVASGQVSLYNRDEPVRITGPETFTRGGFTHLKKAKTIP
ncbi:MAG: hypothetical protein D6778_08765, partial [Nitrospirae bacterium]